MQTERTEERKKEEVPHSIGAFKPRNLFPVKIMLVSNPSSVEKRRKSRIIIRTRRIPTFSEPWGFQTQKSFPRAKMLANIHIPSSLEDRRRVHLNEEGKKKTEIQCF